MARDPFSLKGKVAFVTGANSGLGLTVALSLRDAGAQVAIGARRAARNAEALASLGPSGATFTVDITDEASVERALAGTVERFGHLDILVNNAGVSQRASVMDLDRATWQRVIDTNLTGAFLCTKYAARHMQAQGAGKIINVSSIYGVMAPSKGLQVAYTVAKHGMIGLTRVNAVELAPLGIQVNAIVPGWYFTEMTEELRGTPRARGDAPYARRPLGQRVGPRWNVRLPRVHRLGLCDRRGYPSRRRLHRYRWFGPGLMRQAPARHLVGRAEPSGPADSGCSPMLA